MCGFYTPFWGCAFKYNFVPSVVDFCPKKIEENAFFVLFLKIGKLDWSGDWRNWIQFFLRNKTVGKYRIVSQVFRRRVWPENEKLEKNRKRRGLKEFPIFLGVRFFPFVLFKRYRCYNRVPSDCFIVIFTDGVGWCVHIFQTPFMFSGRNLTKKKISSINIWNHTRDITGFLSFIVRITDDSHT